MEKNQNDFNAVLGDLAGIVDNIQKTFPTSKSVIVYELGYQDFNYVKSNFQNVKVDQTEIKIEISNTEIVFILENTYKIQEKIEEPKIEKKDNFFKKIMKKIKP